MATDYVTVYNALLARVRRDEDWSNLTDDDVFADIHSLMTGAIPLFLYPRENLRVRDDTRQEFTADLKNDTVEQLAEYMFAKWIKRKVADTTTITQMFHSKDVQQYSQASHLKTTKEYAKEAMGEAEKLAFKYSKVTSTGTSALSEGLAGETT